MDKVFVWGKKVQQALDTTNPTISADLVGMPVIIVHAWETLSPQDQQALVTKFAALGFDEE